MASLSRCEIRVTFGSSGQLSQQIQNGAPYDLFLSASPVFVKPLKTLSTGVYAYGRLVLWSRSGPVAWADLASPKVRRIAIANPKLAPYGLAAKQALESQGLWPKVESKIVYAENVRQAYQFAESGNADVCLVSSSLVGGKNGFVLPSTWHQPIEQTAALLRDSPGARKLFDFLTGPGGRDFFRRHGLE